MSLPKFRYHPDPIASGSVEPSDVTCVCCDKKRGYVYMANTYAVKEVEEELCPWCIADGSAHAEFDAEFTDIEDIGANAPDAELRPEVIEEVAFRTPGFVGWQQERWLACCNDAAAFLGLAGYKELQEKWPEAIASVQEETGLKGAEWEGYLKALDIDESPTAYVFRCLHCAKLLAYSDCH